MTIAITSIQRNRAPWLMEWLAFHLVVGFDRFYMYTHKCSDDSTALLAHLSRRYTIVVHSLDADEVLPQLVAYQHAWNSYGREVNWMAFVNGDEFLFRLPAQTWPTRWRVSPTNRFRLWRSIGSATAAADI